MQFVDLTRDEQNEVVKALRFLGMPTAWCQISDICESGQVFVGLTEVLPRGSVNYQTKEV